MRLTVPTLVLGTLLLSTACGSTVSGTAGDNRPEIAASQTTPPTGTVTEAVEVVTYRSPTCGCCKGWVAHMEQQGFRVQDNVVEDMEAIKAQHQVPADLASCHTAIVGDYVIEGHVPASDVRQLLADRPDVLGITAPGMPIGSPGMESGNIREPYTVFTFDSAGNSSPFSQHNQPN
ncbi:MAG: DUF411 domain-containing protein [Prochlorothrix sp.]